MGRLNPSRLDTSPSIISSSDYSTELEILNKKGLNGRSPSIESHFAGIMNEVGLDPRAMMIQLSMIMQTADTDATKLHAVKLATQLWMHPAVVVARDKAADNKPVVNFVISGDKVQVNNILTPST